MIKKYLNILFYMFSFIFIYYLLVSGTNYEILPSLLIMVIVFIDIAMYIADEYESSIITEKQKAAQFAAEIKRMEVQEKEFVAMIQSRELIPYTRENVRILMGYLTRTNWGFWELPKMEVGYTASQYETENGRTFVNVKFDSGLKVSNAPTTYLHKGYVPLRSLDENLKP